MASSAPQFSYVQEWNQAFLSLFPHRFDYIFAPFPQLGEKPVWRTESRHPLSDRIISQGSQLFGVRFGAETQYALLDIDRQSAYHPAQDPLALDRLLSSLEPLGLVTPIICTSSYSQGLHVYFPFKQAQRSWKLASAIATLVEASGFKIKSGQLEIFPNTKHYVTAGSPSLFNAHRLPLQEPGAYLLNRDLEPIWSDQSRFVEQWKRCQQKNDISRVKIRTVLKQQKRTRHFISEKADKFLNDLNAEIEPGWTGKGQTNRLLGRITMRCFIFHHVIAGGEPLSGQSLIDEILATAQSLPGYKAWCRHQHEIGKRITDWVRSIENSHYFPYGSQNGKYKAPAISAASKGSDWNLEQAISAQSRIKAEVKNLTDLNQFPDGITARFKLLAKAGISGSSLYQYKSLWHPQHQSEEANPIIGTECQQARPKGAADWHNPPSLLCENGCNQPIQETSGDSRETFSLLTGCNAQPDGDLACQAVREPAVVIAEIKQFLAAARLEREAVAAQPPLPRLNRAEQRENDRLQAYLAQLEGYLRSGDAVLVAEALDVLSDHPSYLNEQMLCQALEQGLLQHLPDKAPVGAYQAAIAHVLQQLSRLRWSAEQIAQALHGAWGKSRLRELTLGELERWRQQLAIALEQA